jgi:hypothetical protein
MPKAVLLIDLRPWLLCGGLGNFARTIARLRSVLFYVFP